MSRFIDFDAARAEQAQEPVTLRAYGQDFELPAVMPAALFLDIVALWEKGGESAEVNAKEATDLLRRVVSEEVLDALLAEPDFSMADMMDLAKMVVQVYTEREEVPGEAPAPSRAVRRSPVKSTR